MRSSNKKFGALGAIQSEIVYPGLSKIPKKTTPCINYKKWWKLISLTIINFKIKFKMSMFIDKLAKAKIEIDKTNERLAKLSD